jgi:protein-S-isoprenylcysteine O-methyltransferase Ste14
MLGSATRGLPVPDWSSLVPGMTLWALALYLPLSAPLARLEEALAEGPLSEPVQIVALVISSLLLALGVGVITQLLLSWALSPSWAASLGLMAALAGGFWTLASRGAGKNE